MKTDLYTIRNDVRCVRCGNKGAVQRYGKYYPDGMKEDTPNSKVYEKHRDKPYLSRTGGFGGTIPHQCLNCGNTGLINHIGLEGLKKAFETINED